MHDPLWLTTEAGRLRDTPEYAESDEAVFEELWSCGYLGDAEPADDWGRRLAQLSAGISAERSR